MPGKITLNQSKNDLVKQVKKHKSVFYSKASMNSLISKIDKSKSFKKVDEYKSILNYVIKNNVTYKSKLFKQIVNDVELSNKLQDEKIVKKINVTYTQSLTDDFSSDKLQKQIVDKLIKMTKQKPNNLIKVNIKFPYFDIFDSTIEPQDVTNNKRSHLSMLVFWLLNNSSEIYKISEYFNDKSNRVNTVKITINSYPKITSFQLADHYRLIQNFSNSGLEILCVPNAIINYFNKKIEDTTQKNTIGKYQRIINKLQQPSYNKRYNIKELEELSDEILCSFTIKDFINQDITIGHGSNKRYNIMLLNTKLNHLENYNNEEVIIDEKDVSILLNELSNYIKVGHTIYTKDKTYIIDQGEFSKLHHEHIEKYNINRNYIKADSKESEYISNYYMSVHQIFNSKLFQEYKKEIEQVINNQENFTSDLDYGLDVESYSILDKLKLIEKKENELFKEIDLIKAYYNLTNSSAYGVPSNSFIYYDNEYCKDIETHIKEKIIGYYTITINDNTEKINMMFGNNKNNIVLTTPQIMTLKNNGVNFIILNCIIAPSIPFKYSKEMLIEEKNIKHYCKSTGIFMKHNIVNKKYLKTQDPEEFIKIIDNKKNNIELSINQNNIIEISEDTNSTLKHIGYFIHSFTSSEIMNFIFNNNINDILGVKLDSIIVKKHENFNFNSLLYKSKNANIYKLIGLDDAFCKSYIETSNYINNCQPCIFSDDKQLYKKIINLSGKGGSGKTSDIQNNFQCDEVCYSALAWSRGVDFSSDGFNCMILSLNKLIGDKTEQAKLSKFCKIIALDEDTLIDNKIIRQTIHDYPDKRIIIIGDIDSDGFNYQCSMNDNLIKGFQMFNPNFYDCQIIEYIRNYRFDDELNNKLDKLRQFMKINRFENNKIQLLNDYVENEFRECFVDKSRVFLNRGDMGISAHQESKLQFKYTNYYINKGSQPLYYNNKTIFEKNIFKGDFSYEKPSHNNFEIRLFESVHACQGKTVPLNSKLLIIIEKNFDYQLLYTAMSRARSLSQINIVTGF